MSGNQKQIGNVEKDAILEHVEQVLTSGETARHSGIYKLQHNSHAVDEEIFIREGTILPSCHDCGNPMTFLLVRKVKHIEEDPDFQ